MLIILELPSNSPSKKEAKALDILEGLMCPTFLVQTQLSAAGKQLPHHLAIYVKEH